MTLLWFIHFSNLSCRHGYLVCLASLLFPWWPKCFLLFPFQCHPDSIATTCRQGEYASVRGSVVLRASRRLSEIWMHATQLQIVCVFVGVHVCACVRLLSHTSGLGGPRHTHTQTVHEWSSQLIEECRNGCQFYLLQLHHTSPWCTRGPSFLFYTIFNFILKSLRRKKIQNLRFCRVCKALRLICLSTYLTLGS